jgi:hypothetical protein
MPEGTRMKRDVADIEANHPHLTRGRDDVDDDDDQSDDEGEVFFDAPELEGREERLMRELMLLRGDDDDGRQHRQLRKRAEEALPAYDYYNYFDALGPDLDYDGTRVTRAAAAAVIPMARLGRSGVIPMARLGRSGVIPMARLGRATGGNGRSAAAIPLARLGRNFMLAFREEVKRQQQQQQRQQPVDFEHIPMARVGKRSSAVHFGK